MRAGGSSSEQRDHHNYFLALAIDFDGTLAQDGQVDAEVLAALRAFKSTGRKLILITGRRLIELRACLSDLSLFDRVVAENGAVVHDPLNTRSTLLCAPPSQLLVQLLTERFVAPLQVGEAIVATWHPHERAVLAAIRELGLELEIVFNKGAIMILPTGVNKGFGLKSVLEELDISALHVVAVGDAENDHSFMLMCGCSAAVGNALQSIKSIADIIVQRDHGAGVVEILELVSSREEEILTPSRRGIDLGRDQGNTLHFLFPDDVVLVVGNSGCGKSSFATMLTEKMVLRQHEFCILDPEGDYLSLEDAATIGNIREPPAVQEAVRLLLKAGINVVINTQALTMSGRQALFGVIFSCVKDLRQRTGRPQWLVVDEAHHVMPATSGDFAALPLATGTVLICLEPKALPASVLREVTVLIALGSTARDLVQDFAVQMDRSVPSVERHPLPDEVLVWRTEKDAIAALKLRPPKQVHNRHAGKYATGDVGEWRSFQFRDANGHECHRARNLREFVWLSEIVEGSIWLRHLDAGDFARWFKDVIKDDTLARCADDARGDKLATLEAKRSLVIKAIGSRYQI